MHVVWPTVLLTVSTSFNTERKQKQLYFLYLSCFHCEWSFSSLYLQTASVTSRQSRLEGMWTPLVGARLQPSCSAPLSYSWLPSCLYSAQSEESPGNGLSWLDHRTSYPATPPLKEHFLKKNKKKTLTISLAEKREEGTSPLKPLLFFDLPTRVILDFLAGADGWGAPRWKRRSLLPVWLATVHSMQILNIYLCKRQAHIHAFKQTTHTHTHTHNINDTISTLFSLNGKEAQQDPSKVYRLNIFYVQENIM